MSFLQTSNTLLILSSTVKNLKDLDQNSIEEIIKNSQEEINNTEIRNISIGQSYKKIVILIVLNLIKNYNIKFFSRWLLFVITLASCDSNFLTQKFNNSLTTGVLKRDEIIPTFKSFKVSLFTSYALF